MDREQLIERDDRDAIGIDEHDMASEYRDAGVSGNARDIARDTGPGHGDGTAQRRSIRILSDEFCAGREHDGATRRRCRPPGLVARVDVDLVNDGPVVSTKSFVLNSDVEEQDFETAQVREGGVNDGDVHLSAHGARRNSTRAAGHG